MYVAVQWRTFGLADDDRLLQKQLNQNCLNQSSMAHDVSADLMDLLARFVRTYSSIVDLELDENQNPKRWFMPLDSYGAKREAAHYFLLAASLSDYRLVGNPRNIRMLLHHLHNALGDKLYVSKNSADFASQVVKYEQDIVMLDQLGEAKGEIPEVLSSVNRFVEQKAHGNLIEYASKLSQKGWKPEVLAKELSYKVKGMNKHRKSKCWLYLRWMVRPSPDLGLFQFAPRDLMVALTTPKLRVLTALGLAHNENLAFELNVKNRPESWWKNTEEFDEDATRLTNFARSLFPDDPAKVDFPFFMLGTWLEYADLTRVFLEKSLRFLNQKYEELKQPITRYLTVVSHYNRAGEAVQPGAFTGFEGGVYDFLVSRQVIFNYEFMEFCLPKETPGADGFLTYKPDFLLPQFTNNGRKVLLEPHGVKSNLREVLFKLSIFRKHYGDYFCLILIVPDDFAKAIEELDPQRSSYDFLWMQSDYRVQFEKFRRS